ncbi:hypothetical protein S40285_07928 [Stachybotrys chlorohalonatus IBT 40285]|uniref:Threonine/serine exporter-like N-terminal domain-containing protein n=1 Tax=Stachybotrys chlorohalonatus (strain IBT 40285) TaxID=1283841 RepID=A0A084R109_STAC4|nr:hypothetical protein S40285_07928 [Stachybotrys chlorohalonata IBT 40285]
MDGASSSQDDPDPDPGVKPSAETPSPNAPQATYATKEKGRVRFNSNAAATQRPVPPSAPSPRGPSEFPRLATPPTRPAIVRGNSSNSVLSNADSQTADHGSESPTARMAAEAAQARARQVAAKVQAKANAPSSPRFSTSSSSTDSSVVRTVSSSATLARDQDIPLIDLGPSATLPQGTASSNQPTQGSSIEAQKLGRLHVWRAQQSSSANESAIASDEDVRKPSEMYEGTYDGVYNVPPPQHYRGGVLSQLLKLYKSPDSAQQYHHRRTMSASSAGGASTSSGTTTPNRRKWYEQNRSQDTLANLVAASAKLANPNTPAEDKTARNGPGRSKHKRTGSQSRLMSTMWQEDAARITVHIAGTLARQEFIMKLCRALMLYGAPTHRLEEYLSMTARVLEIDGQFLYIPGCMIISFDDRTTHTTEMKIVRLTQGIDLGKLKDVHRIYKEVMHDVMGVEEATEQLDALISRNDKFHPWFRVLVFGLTSVAASPFSFNARLIDLPLCFCLGCLVGVLQLFVAAKSQFYSNVFEVSATVAVSFLARAFGSLAGGDLFCYSALVQGGIVMLLPGYMVLSSSLELQSRAIVPGSIRIVYAIIYSLLLGFGITVGAALYGVLDNNATSETTCRDTMPQYYGFIFVPFFVVCISILYQAKWRQMPMMVIIACAGYVVNYFSSRRFVASPQIASTLGALAVGLLANLYSRVRHGVAAALLIPAVFTQVPGGLASTGGLLSGLRTANLINNSTQSVNGTGSVQFEETASLNNVVFEVAASMVQIAIGIAVGLFLSALFVYPFGKRRSGLFSL